jgi:hypothetical protein
VVVGVGVIGVAVGSGVEVGVRVGSGVAVGVGVALGVAVKVAVAVRVGVAVRRSSPKRLGILQAPRENASQASAKRPVLTW